MKIYLLKLTKRRRSCVNEKNMSSERALSLDQWNKLSKNHKLVRV